MIYFFQKSAFQKFWKKGLGMSICTHMTHLKNFSCGVSGENHENFGVLFKGSECVCGVQILSPSLFWTNSETFHELGAFF